MLIINLSYSKHSENVVEIMFEGLNKDWFTALFPLVDVEFDEMKKYYIGRDFYETKASYEGKIFSEADKSEC
jgi:hypothetical protein